MPAGAATIRFGVRSGPHRFSATWRLWAWGSEIYLAARDLGGVFKISLHKVGGWRAAYTKESGITSPETSDRTEVVWQGPPEFRPGWTQGPTVLVPILGIREPFTINDAAEGSDVTWVAAPAPGTKVLFTVLISRHTLRPDKEAGLLQRGDSIIGQFSIATGETVWLSKREVPLGSSEEQELRGFARDMRVHHEDPASILGANVFQIEKDTTPPLIVDLTLGRENVVTGSAPIPEREH